MAQHTKLRGLRPLRRPRDSVGAAYPQSESGLTRDDPEPSDTQHMNVRSTYRCIFPTLLALAALAVAAPAQTLPATAPTALPAANALPAPIAAKPTVERPHHADVTYVAGMLNVRADNSSLNQILRIISQLTGMKISGGVADQRVFGNYGPSTPPVILATLLDGTGSNMLLREGGQNGVPNELILTPRGGGPTPPGPDNSMYADDRQAPPLLPQRIYSPSQNTAPTQPSVTAPNNGPVPAQNNGPVAGSSTGPVGSQNATSSTPQPLNNVNGSASNVDPTAINFPTTQSVPVDTLPTPSTTPSTPGIVDAPNPPPAGSTTSPNPGNVATPEQIYQQLKALQQQHSSQSGSRTQ
jgi:hypothetical protein